ncbi:MAG TPA: phosphotransferase [Tepidisphaeraceae bacterium]|nr:phosphotransferase [Tepidisphaeraceae bacterium]
MRTRESIYIPLGYDVAYVKREKFRGWGSSPVEQEYCIARKDGAEFYAWYDRDGLYADIMKVQDHIPHMARFREPAQNHILMEAASGQLIWHMNSAPDAAEVERQLSEFAASAGGNEFAHQDIRPWNVFIDEHSYITVIDWGNSRRGKSSVDAEDVAKFSKLLRGEITFQVAWGWNPHWYPEWCKHD